MSACHFRQKPAVQRPVAPLGGSMLVLKRRPARLDGIVRKSLAPITLKFRKFALTTLRSITKKSQLQVHSTDGNSATTGQTARCSLISQNGQCPPQPKACGDTPNGGTVWQDNGQTPPFKCGTCIDCSDHNCVAVMQQQL